VFPCASTPNPMKTKLRKRSSSSVNLGFQIAPMIDVVFVIMLFFMVMAGRVQIEKHHRTQLPHYDGSVPVNEEVLIRIDDDGQVSLNDDPLDAADSSSLPQLASSLRLLRESSDAARSTLSVIIQADEAACYQRIVDTLDALSLAHISNVTFEVASFEE
jgi:biopolymer transport protein ExbD